MLNKKEEEQINDQVNIQDFAPLINLGKGAEKYLEMMAPLNDRFTITWQIQKHLNERLAHPHNAHQFKEFINALNQEIKGLLDNAVERAKQNGRNLVEEFDL